MSLHERPAPISSEHTALSKLFAILLVSVLAASWWGPTFAQARPKVTHLEGDPPRSVLFVGNSYFYFNNGIDALVGGLVGAAFPGKPFGGAMVTIGGASWKWHDIDSYFRPDAINSFSMDGNRHVTLNDTSKGSLFDVAVMMDCSLCAIDPALSGDFFAYARKNSETVRRHGARPVFFMTWAYADQPEMTQQVAQAYTKAGNDNDALVVPAGLAFARVKKDRPDIDLQIWDKTHPTLAGSYLAACTVFASLFGQSPAGLKYDGGVPRSIARRLQEAAWATVQAYYGP